MDDCTDKSAGRRADKSAGRGARRCPIHRVICSMPPLHNNSDGNQMAMKIGDERLRACIADMPAVGLSIRGVKPEGGKIDP